MRKLTRVSECARTATSCYRYLTRLTPVTIEEQMTSTPRMRSDVGDVSFLWYTVLIHCNFVAPPGKRGAEKRAPENGDSSCLCQLFYRHREWW